MGTLRCLSDPRAALAFRRLLELPEVRHLPEDLREALAAEAVESTWRNPWLWRGGSLGFLALVLAVVVTQILLLILLPEKSGPWLFCLLLLVVPTFHPGYNVVIRRATRLRLQAILHREGLYRPVCLRCGEDLTGREGPRCPACEARLPRVLPVEGPAPRCVTWKPAVEARRQALKCTARALRLASERAERGERLEALWGRWIVKLRRVPDVSQLKPVDRDRLTVEAAGKASREPLVRTLVKMLGVFTCVAWGVLLAIFLILDRRTSWPSSGPTISIILLCVFLATIAFREAASVLGYRLARRHLRELLALEGLRGPPAQQL
ncbi:MAG: hypothetical protein HY721_07120 [Planctomycetes bacterium]|nr:hypothetical protein [Planctomycetota bacterium]